MTAPPTPPPSAPPAPRTAPVDTAMAVSPPPAPAPPGLSRRGAREQRGAGNAGNTQNRCTDGANGRSRVDGEHGHDRGSTDHPASQTSAQGKAPVNGPRNKPAAGWHSHPPPHEQSPPSPLVVSCPKGQRRTLRISSRPLPRSPEVAETTSASLTFATRVWSKAKNTVRPGELLAKTIGLGNQRQTSRQGSLRLEPQISRSGETPVQTPTCGAAPGSGTSPRPDSCSGNSIFLAGAE
jgi:hypothetical protein